MLTLPETIAQELGLPAQQAAAALALLDDGNTLPFIARYRKEATGGLDEEQLRDIFARADALRALDDRRQTILASLAEQELLTDALAAQLQAATTRTELEDIYQPYRPKRRTRASAAREAGLQPLADLILAQPLTRQTPAELAAPFVCDAAPAPEDALAGARDIVAEITSDNTAVRGEVREKALRFGVLRASKLPKAEDERLVYKLYYEFEQRIDRLRPHQVLAINRGEEQKILRVAVDVPERDWHEAMTRQVRLDKRSPLAHELSAAMADGAARLLLPAIERDVRRTLTEQAEAHAIRVFGENLRGLLSQPPLADQTILAIDPGFRTGCKVAVVDPTGRVLTTSTIYPHAPQKRVREAQSELIRLCNAHGVTLMVIGNGTASRETEQLVADLIRSRPANASPLHYLVVNEAGASVYSASPLARAELPDMDVSLRGAVSLARRVQDPLAELVKIDPQSIGVGMYQHDVDQKALAGTLDGVVESVVNQVGVDVNTASPALLTYVAGIGPKLADRIVARREEVGSYVRRTDLFDVTGMGVKTFEQAVGFLRVRGGPEPLDASAIHPESYGAADVVLARAQVDLAAPPEEKEAAFRRLCTATTMEELARAAGTGVLTLGDILEQLVRPGRDPREELPPPILRSDVLSMDDLLPGMTLQGTVRNVVDFGAFIDIGVKQDGLLHRSRIPRHADLSVGQVVSVEVLSVEAERGRISLGWAEDDA
ncbi:MAG: RNA-binding transcriptional accessory protein [Caldilineaceae bacterium]|nr:RNA-binding transcriptional accessory protein [Caldilineaceae bacterium]